MLVYSYLVISHPSCCSCLNRMAHMAEAQEVNTNRHGTTGWVTTRLGPREIMWKTKGTPWETIGK